MRSVDAGVSGGGGAGAGGTAVAGLLGGALGGSRAKKQNEELVKAQQELLELTEKLAPIEEKRAANFEKQIQQTQRIVDLERQRNVQEKQLANNSKLVGKARDDAKLRLGEVKNELKSLNASQRGLVNSATEYTNELSRQDGKLNRLNNQVTQSAKRTKRAYQGVLGVVTKIALAIGAARLAQKSLQAGIGRAESERRIKFLAQGYGEVAELTQAAADSAQKFGLSQTEANKALANVYARLRPVGVTLEEIVTSYNGFNTAAKLSGVNAVEAAQSFRQLAQALGSGRLQGDEFRTISEAIPSILTAISKETGIAQGKLRDYAAEGKLTADIVIRALARIEKEGADQLSEALGGPEQAIKDFQNASEEVAVALTKTIIPEMSNAFRELAGVILALEKPIAFIGSLIGNLLTETRLLITAIKGQGTAIGSLRAGKLSFNVASATKEFEEFFGKDRFKQLQQQAKDTAKATGQSYSQALRERLSVALKVIDRTEGILRDMERKKALEALLQNRPDLTAKDTVKVGDTVGGRDFKGLDFTEANEFNELLIEQKKNYEAIREELERNYQLNLTANDVERQRLENAFSYEDLVSRINAEVGENNREELKALARRNEALDDAIILAQKFEDVFAEGQAIDDLIDDSNQLRSIWQGLGSEITNVLDAFIQGTDDWNNVLQNTLRSLSKLLLNAGLSAIGSGSPKGSFLNLLFGGGKAAGGPVSGGTSYLVGEKGPELFTPGTSGNITPNDALGGSTVVNITVNDNGGGSASGSGPNANEARALARMIESSTLAIINREKRPGGTLSFSR